MRSRYCSIFKKIKFHEIGKVLLLKLVKKKTFFCRPENPNKKDRNNLTSNHQNKIAIFFVIEGLDVTGGRLTKIHLIKIVFFQLIKSFIIS